MDTEQWAPNDPWYAELNKFFGSDFVYSAGYFEEYKKWTKPYSEVFDLPENTNVIQYSGAFYPFHEGHLSIIKAGIDRLIEKGITDGVVVLHVDHSSYQKSKGFYPEDKQKESFKLFNDFFPYKGFVGKIIFEDDMPDGCSRNFTRLYSELYERNESVYFLCGGDRANFVRAFLIKGNCIVAGRSSDSSWFMNNFFFGNYPRFHFIKGNDLTSSTQIRKSL